MYFRSLRGISDATHSVLSAAVTSPYQRRFRWANTLLRHQLLRSEYHQRQKISTIMSGNPLISATPEKLAALPAATAPEGVKSNLKNPHSDGPKLIITGAFLMTLMYIFAGIRFYMKIFVRKKITADDCEAIAISPEGIILISCRDHINCSRKH
jgi:hypothetical protein